MKRFRAVAFIVAASLASNVVARAGGFIDLRRMPSPGGDAAAGKAKATTCAACHGANGISAGAVFPNLAGQHEAYLYERLVEFKREMRPESVMTTMSNRAGVSATTSRWRTVEADSVGYWTTAT